jgi:hypothetical protein
MAFNNPAVSDFQNQFFRDFPYGTDSNVSVLAQDIANAFVQVNASINQSLFGDQATYTFYYLLLAAHYMVLNLRASSQGLNGQWNWAQNNKSVAGVSEGFEIPERIKGNPDFMAYYKTHYGAQYMNYCLPQLAGQMFNVRGSGGLP